MTTFAEYLQAQMDERGWRQSDLARAAGINRAYISEYLRKGSVPKRQNLEKIAHGLGVSVREVEQAAEAAPHRGVFQLSPERQTEAETLTRSQVALISEMIRHLAEGNRQYTYRKHGTIYQEPDLPLDHKREAANEEVTEDDDSAPITHLDDHRRPGHDPVRDQCEVAALEGSDLESPGEDHQDSP